MSGPIKDGGPAFPVIPPGDMPSGFPYPDSGMTLRDYFAAKVLPSVFLDFQTSVRNGECESDRMWKNEIAATVYGMADAMLAAREVKA